MNHACSEDRMAETQQERVQAHAAQRVHRAPVGFVSHDRVTELREVRTDLVFSAGPQSNLEHAQV